MESVSQEVVFPIYEDQLMIICVFYLQCATA